MFKKIIIILAALLLALLAFAATRPDSFRVQRQITIQAPPDKIYASLNDFHKWGTWSPWEKLDPAMKRSFSGADSGKGAVYAWESKGVGSGRMEILDAQAGQGVKIKLDFTQPFEAHNTVDLILVPQAGTASPVTQVTWAMQGPSNYITKLMHMFFSMDTLVGKDFEKGLADLKAMSEK